MSQHRLTALMGAIAAVVAGCSSEPQTPPPSAISPTPAPVTASRSSAQAARPFAKPLVAQKTTTPGAIPGLIQPTNSRERGAQVAAQTNAQKSDPFSSLPSIPVKSAANNAPPSSVAKASGNRLPSGTPLLPTPDMPKIAIAPNKPTIVASKSTTVASKPRPAIILPPKPSTDLAQAVEVTGVILVNGAPKAIVKASNEDTSRYVTVGERLSSGKVLVKRIEMNSGSEPIVILEENGVEVARGVGDKPIAQSGKPSA